MTSNHIFYIPVIFLLGVIVGLIFSSKDLSKENRGKSKNPSPSLLFLTFLIFILIFIITHIFEIPYGSKQVSSLLGEQEIFDKQPVFSAKEVYAKIQTFSAEGLNSYKRFTYTIDILFPLSFFIFLITFSRFVSTRSVLPIPVSKWIIYLPVLWLCTDLLENMLIFTILYNFPTQLLFLGDSLGIVTVVKFSLLIFSLLDPVIAYLCFERK